MKHVALLMSGGVDSSVAACLLLEQGYGVTGVHLKLFTFGDKKQKEESFQKVQEVSHKIGIPCHLLDLEALFKTKVIDSFIQSYKSGSTPNPCVVCNQTIKFGAFFDYARETLGADFISSGHYARVVQNLQTTSLAKAVDAKKDQSYFLYQLNQEILSRLILPLGTLTKPEVRTLAKKFDLTTDFGKESEDVCFFSGDYQSFIQGCIPDHPGNIIDSTGKILGHHQGIHYYTVGQRQGLGISSPDPLYVIDLDPVQNTVMVGKRIEAFSSELLLPKINWISGSPPSLDTPIKAKVRYRGEEKACHLHPVNDSPDNEAFQVIFEEPQFAITNGQSIVFYQGEQVLGGGVIILEKGEK
jgi:tRNA-uridine 2-sulfurtransferase